MAKIVVALSLDDDLLDKLDEFSEDAHYSRSTAANLILSSVLDDPVHGMKQFYKDMYAVKRNERKQGRQKGNIAACES